MKVESQEFDRIRSVIVIRPRRSASDPCAYLPARSKTKTVDDSGSAMSFLARSLMPELKAQYLLTLPAIRDRCSRVHDLAKEGKLEYFEYHPENEEKVADFCLQIIQVVGVLVLSPKPLTGSWPSAKQRDFQTNYASIPPHGRWRHIDAGLPRVEPLLGGWRSSPNPPSDKEITKRLIDLFLVSVLLDAGAGNVWSYTEASSGQKFSRSEGLGVASVHMFTGGLFSGDPDQPYRVDGQRHVYFVWILTRS